MEVGTREIISKLQTFLNNVSLQQINACLITCIQNALQCAVISCISDISEGVSMFGNSAKENLKVIKKMYINNHTYFILREQ